MPYKDPEKKREHNRKSYQARAGVRRAGQYQKKEPGRQFIGVDGEGATIDGHHIYNMLSIGENVLTNPDGLSTLECLNFITSFRPGFLYVGYFFDYDVTMILRDLDHETLAQLLDRNSRTTEKGYSMPVSWKGFRIDWLPNKEFRVAKGISKFVTINDVGTFFQCRFTNALKTWGVGTPEQLAMIEEGKNSRSSFNSLAQSTIEYNQLEIVLLQELMEKYRRVFGDIDITPKKWQGPGQIAVAALHKHNIVKNRDLAIDNGVLGAFQWSYYGGRFEVSTLGEIPGPIYDYDLNSAYPDAIRNLPCLEHGEWIETTTPEGIYVALVEMVGDDSQMWHSLPVRNKNGNIHYPSKVRGWYTYHELENVFEYDKVRVIKARQYVQRCDCRPFSWVEELYQLRKSVGKDSKGLAIKTVLNSIYGKLAQSVGKPQFANPIWASLITSSTRGKILEAMRGDPGSVVMIATDGIFTKAPLPLEDSSELGKWSASTFDSIFIIGPGVYLVDGSLRNLKTRGTSKTLIDEKLPEIRKNWEKLLSIASDDNYLEVIPLCATPIHYTQFMGLRISMSRTDGDSIRGEWKSVKKDVTFGWHTKRDQSGWRVEGKSIVTKPYTPLSPLLTLPYRKESIPLPSEWSLEMLLMDQPDWVFERLGSV